MESESKPFLRGLFYGPFLQGAKSQISLFGEQKENSEVLKGSVAEPFTRFSN